MAKQRKGELIPNVNATKQPAKIPKNTTVASVHYQRNQSVINFLKSKAPGEWPCLHNPREIKEMFFGLGQVLENKTFEIN